MNQTSKSMEKKIRSVKTWLDRAEQAYADDSTAKGQLQLMLAKAEMQHLDEQQNASKRYKLYLIGCLVFVVLISFALYMTKSSLFNHMMSPTDSQFTTTNTVPGVDTTNGVTGVSGNGEASTSTEPNRTAGEHKDASVEENIVNTEATVPMSSDSGPVNGTEAVRANESADSSEPVAPYEGEGNAGDGMTQAAPESKKEDIVTEPVISNSQIQEAVREGGRSLRGQ